MNVVKKAVSLGSFVILVLFLSACGDDEPGNSGTNNQQNNVNNANNVNNVNNANNANNANNVNNTNNTTNNVNNTNNTNNTTNNVNNTNNTNNTNNGMMCPQGETECGADGCVDTTSNPDHCGGCGVLCEGGMHTVPSCENSGCVFECEAGFVDADGDLQDPNGNGCELECTPTGAEVCDGQDNDCDGQVDEDFMDLGQSCTRGVGACENSGMIVCTQDETGTECSVSAGTPAVSVEDTCDGIDENCDGTVDEGCDDDMDNYCDDSFTVTAGASCMAGDCRDDNDLVYPGAPGLCDDLDNDCNGEVDDVRLVPTSPNVVSIGGDAGTSSVPPQLMVAPSDDGFCVARGSGALATRTIQFDHVDAAGNVTSQGLTRSGGGKYKILDTAFANNSCIALAREQITGSIGTPTEYRLQLFRWELGTTSVERLRVDADDLYPDDDVGVFNAAMRIVPPAPGCSLICIEKLVVAYVQRVAGNYKVVYRDTSPAFTSGSTVASANDIASNVALNGTVELGPSPDPDDEWLAMWTDFTILSGTVWRAATRPYSNAAPTSRTDLALDNTNGPYSFPVLGEIDGTPYIAVRNSGTGELDIADITSSYQFGIWFTAPDSGTASFAARNIFADPIRTSTWVTTVPGPSGTPINVTTSAAGWLLQPYADVLERVVTGFGNYTETTAIPNSSSSEFVGIRTSVDMTSRYVQVMRTTNTSPLTVAIDEFTCY